MSKKLIEIASEIVQAQVSLTPMSGAEITAALRQVFGTLHELQRAESGEIELPKIQESAPAKAITPENSIQNDKVICLECGAEMKVLTSKHLVSHGMDQKQYRKKYGFSMKTPLAAKSLTKVRSKAAKKRGLPEKLRNYLETRRKEKAGALKPAPTETVTATRLAAAEAVQEGHLKEMPVLTPENSIQEDKVICLECGGEFKQLTQTHLSSHGMSPKEYKSKYGFSIKTALLAKSLVKAPGEAARKRSLPENLKKATGAKRQEKAKASKPATTEAVPAGKPKQTRIRKKNA
jgi:predicted transcriptional regulator